MNNKKRLFAAIGLVCSGLVFGTDTQNLSDAFYTAIRANDLARLESMLEDGASANTKDSRGITPLMYAAAVGSVEAMKILTDKGADVNARNAFDSTALIWSAADLAKVRLLVEHGADVNAVSKQGRTPLLVAAMSEGSAPILRLLISKGANVKVIDAMKVTALLAACGGQTSGQGSGAHGGHNFESIKLLVDAGVDVNAADIGGDTPLIRAAASGDVAAVKLLLASGANVNAVNVDKRDDAKNGPVVLGRFTPLMVSSAFGPPEIVKALLDASAEVNARDIRGMTPLMLAVATDHQDPQIIRMLLARGADVNAKSNLGETALDWARKVGLPVGLTALGANSAGRASVGSTTRNTAADNPIDPRGAVERGITLLEKTTSKFFVEGGCISCHAQNLTDIAVGAARAHGIRVDEKAAEERKNMVRGFLGSATPMLFERMDPGGGSDSIAYLLAGLASAGYLPDRITDALVANLAVQQSTEGNWHYGNFSRPPFEEGDFFRTALAIRALNVFGTRGRAAEMAQRIDKARQWLERTKPLNSEDRNMQLLGLSWAGAAAPQLSELAKAVLIQQRSDGGWAQRDGLSSDAYATGETLYALAAGGVKSAVPAYQNGVRFLVSTQAPDGSWRVSSRSLKFQPYFESGFPYGHDQWISAAATGWAVAALAQAI